jgi:peptide/nickel transport system permease protein
VTSLTTTPGAKTPALRDPVVMTADHDAETVGFIPALKRALRSPVGAVSLGVAVVMIVLGLLAGMLAPFDVNFHDVAARMAPPGGDHLLGTDETGRDELSRILMGLRTSIYIGLLTVFMAALAGIPVGLLAGFSRVADRIIAPIIDVMLAFPFLILAVGLAAILGPSATNAAIALAAGSVPGFIRITRGEVLRLRGLDFVASAAAAGATGGRILFRHILPNASSALLVQVTVTIPNAILGEAMLSFLGLGIQPPEPSLGTMLTNAQPYIARAWWMALFPGLAIVTITLALNLFGDALRDAFDPKGTKR